MKRACFLKKRFCLWLVCSLVILSGKVLFVSASETPEAEELDLTDLQMEEDFFYKELEWGSTKEQVEEELDITLEPMKEFPHYFISEESVVLEGREGLVRYEFRPNLEWITFTFDSEDNEDDLSEFLENILTVMEDSYGEYESSENQKYNWKGYRWMHLEEQKNGTSLQVLTDSENKRIVEVTIALGAIRQSDTEESES